MTDLGADGGFSPTTFVNLLIIAARACAYKTGILGFKTCTKCNFLAHRRTRRCQKVNFMQAAIARADLRLWQIHHCNVTQFALMYGAGDMSFFYRTSPKSFAVPDAWPQIAALWSGSWALKAPIRIARDVALIASPGLEWAPSEKVSEKNRDDARVEHIQDGSAFRGSFSRCLPESCRLRKKP